MNGGEGRKRERTALVAVLSVGLLIGGLVALFFHAHVADNYGNTATCITAWDRMTGNFGHFPVTASNYSAAVSVGTACEHRISGLDLIAAVCLIGAVLVAVGGLVAIVRGESRERSTSYPR